MNRTIAFLAAFLFCTAGVAYAAYHLSNKGEWPDTWPKELEPLRKQANTHVGPVALHRHYGIPFAKREEMEAAWPHLLKLLAKGAPIRLVRGPAFFLGGAKAGVVVHSPPATQTEPAVPPADVRQRLGPMTWIELVVDGEIVDLNRLRLPEDSPILDARFKEEKKEE